MSEKLVSIIIPAFNRASSIGEAIQSAQAQSYPAKQIIVIDDGSQDNTFEVVKQFEGVEYYRQENKGQAGARNLGLNYAKGEYITSLDSDDVWNDNFLINSINCLEKHDLDFVFLNWTSTDKKENFIDYWKRKKKWRKFIEKADDEWQLLKPRKIRQLFLEACPSPSSSLVVRRNSIVKNWNEAMIASDDWYLMLEMALAKSCRGAFTFTPYWLKRVFGDNVYDGRNRLEVFQNALHDETLMVGDFDSQLTAFEKYTLRKRLALYHLEIGRINWKNNGDSKGVFHNVVAGFGLAPFGASYQVAVIFKDHLKYRLKTILLR